MRSIAAYLRGLLLRPDESNRDTFLSQIALAMNAVSIPRSARDPYVRNADGRYDSMDEFDELPETVGVAEDVLKNAMGALNGAMRWHSLASLYNVTPPVLLPAAAAHAVTTLYNPNAMWDFVSGGVVDMERQIARQMAGLMGWSRPSSDGIFTFGGKAGLIYGIRMGLNRCRPDVSRVGLGGGPRPYVLGSACAHYSIPQCCSLLGIGQDAYIQVSTTNEPMDRQSLRSAIDRVVASGGVVAAIVATGSNTLDNVVDPVDDIAEVIDEAMVRHDLTYRPWLHLDLALGWPWLTVRGHEGPVDGRELPAAAVAVARSQRGSELADSACFDFHKLGLVPYASSMVIVKNWRELRAAFGDEVPAVDWQGRGMNMRQFHSIEHSRSGAPIVATWVALQTLGRDGLRSYLAGLHRLVERLRYELARAGFNVLNPRSPSLATMFVPVGQRTADVANGRAGPGPRRSVEESFFQRLSGFDSASTEEPVLVGFLPNYAPPGCADGRPALRIYLANPHLSESDLEIVVDHLRVSWEKFEADGHDVEQPQMMSLSRVPR